MAEQGSEGNPTLRWREGETGGNGNPRAARSASRAQMGASPSLRPEGSTELGRTRDERGELRGTSPPCKDDDGRPLDRDPRLWSSPAYPFAVGFSPTGQEELGLLAREEKEALCP